MAGERRRSRRERRRRRDIRALAVALLALIVVLGTASGGGQADAAGPRTLNVEPTTNLKNQVVKVSWTGFTPSFDGAFTVTLYQCKGAVPSTLADCYQLIRPPAGGDPLGTGVQDAITNPDGTGSIFLEVRPAFVLPVLDCSTVHPCSIVAFENDGSVFPTDSLPTSAVTAPLEFAPSPTDCPKVPTFDVVTGGEASSAEALYEWSAETCTRNDPLSIDYTESSSPSGRRDFIEGNVDLGITSMPADPATEPSARPYTYAPIDVSAVVVAFNISDTVTGQRITDMKLSPRLVALLLAGMQPGGPGTHLFQDPEFQLLNPGHSWPENTSPPLLRAEKNADAYLMTRWLQADPAARKFLDGNDTSEVDRYWKGVAYPTDIFEARDPDTIGNYSPRQGTLVNARRLFNFQAPGDGATISPLIDGVMGVFDVVTARKFGLPMASLVPANGSAAAAVAPDQAGLDAGYKAMTATSASPLTKEANVVATDAYPLVKVDYAMVPTAGITAQKAADIADFLKYAANDGQEAEHLPVGYLPLPSDLVTQSAAAQAAVLAAPTNTTTPPPGDQTPLVTDVPTDTGFTGDDFSASFDGFDSSSDFGSSDFDDSVTDVPPADDATVTDDTTVDGEASRQLEPVSARFPGSQGHLLLPFLFVLGAIALVAGPSMVVLLRRQPATANPTEPEAPEPPIPAPPVIGRPPS